MKVIIEIDVADSKLKGLLSLLETTSLLSHKSPVTIGAEVGTGWNPPATKKRHREPAISGRTRRSLSSEEVMFIAEQFIAGNSAHEIAAKVAASEGVITRVGKGSAYTELTGFEPWKNREDDRHDPGWFNHTPTGRLTLRGKEVVAEETASKKAGQERITKARTKAAKKRKAEKEQASA